MPDIEIGGLPHKVVPHTPDMTKFLRSSNFDVLSPIAAQYEWPGPHRPFAVQKWTSELMSMHRRGYVINGLGTGKTRSALWAWHFLYRNKEAGKMLVLCPLSTMYTVWAKEVFEALGEVGIKAAVLYGDTRAKRLKQLAEDVDVYIMNYDGVKVIGPEIEKRLDIDTLCIDELSFYRHFKSKKTKAMIEWAPRFKWLWGMTGSPNPTGPEGAWAQAKIVTPSTTPRYFTRWREEVMLRLNQFKWVPKEGSLARVHALMQPAVRFALDDVTELPACFTRYIDVRMGSKQSKVYEGLLREAYALCDRGEITAANQGAVLSKLLQVSSGWVYTSTGEVAQLDGDERLDACIDTIMAADQKVLVFAPYKHVLTGVHDRIVREGIQVAKVSGDTPIGQRTDIFNAFQSNDDLRVIAAHPACLAHGITLTRADTIIWYGPILSLEIFEQANARIRRIGQKHKQQIIMLRGEGNTIEKRRYSELMRQQKEQNTLLAMFAESTSNRITL